MKSAKNVKREEMVTYRNLFPCQKFDMIKNQNVLGENSFRYAKKTSPCCKLIYKKFEKRDPVLANKKFFRANPNLAEFAKSQPAPKDPEELI